MAIIKGRTPAKILEVSPFSNSIESAAAGIAARDTRANEMRDQINLTKQALLKETREHDDDWELAKSLEQGYKKDVEGLINSADRDYSSLGKDDLQTLAADYVGSTEWRVLEAARTQSAAYESALEKNRSQFGPPVVFGTNPSTKPLKDDSGNWNKFVNTWEVEKRLDHSQAAKKLYDQIGSHLTEKMTTKFATEAGYGSIPNADGSNEPAWVRYWKKRKEGDGTNIPQVDAIINGAINSFIEDPEGKQYYRIHFENFKKDDPTADFEQADKYARDKVQELVTTYGHSEYQTTHTEDETIQIVDKGSGRPGSGRDKTSGSGAGNKPELINPASGFSTHISNSGLGGIDGDQKDVFDVVRSDTTEDVTVQDVAKSTVAGLPVSAYSNNKLLVNSATMTTHPDGGEDPDSPRASGELMNIGATMVGSDIKNNAAAIFFKEKNTNDPSWMNTIPSNYNNLTVNNGIVEIPIETEDGKPTKLTLDADGLVDRLGDDLFLRTEMREASKGLESVMEGNLSWKDALTNKDDDNDLSLSTYIVDQNTGDIDINPLLLNMRDLYTQKIETAKSDGARLLYEAKLQRVNEKISNAEELQTSNSKDFAKVTRQVQLNNEHIKIFKSNMELVGSRWNIPKEIVDAFITGKGGYSKRIRTSKHNTASQIGLVNNIDNMDINDNNNYNYKKDDKGQPIYTEKENKNNIRKIKTLWETHKTKILNGGYSEHDLTVQSGAFRTVTDGLNSTWATILDDYPDLKQWALGAGHNLKVPTRLNLSNTSKGVIWEVNKTGHIILKPHIKESYDTTYKNELKKAFGTTSSNLVEFIEEVEKMNDVIMNEKVSLYKASAANVPGTDHAEATHEEKNILQQRRLLANGEKWIRNAAFESGSGEKFDHQTLSDAIRDRYNQMVADGTYKGSAKSEQDYEKEQLDTAYQGIRYEPDESGGLFVAHYEYNLDGKKYVFEHDVKLKRDIAVKYFGMPSVYFSLGQELKDGLKANKQMYSDFAGFGAKGDVRLHKAQSNIGKGSKMIKRGEYYIISKDQEGNDSDIGSPKYGPNDEGMHKIPFKSYDDFFIWFDQRSRGDMRQIQKLNTWISNIQSGQDLSYGLPSSGPYSDREKYPDTPAGRQKLIADMSADMRAITNEGNNTKESSDKGNFNNAGTIEGYTTAGVVQKEVVTNGNGKEEVKLSITPDTYGKLNNVDKKNIAFTINPTLKNQTWHKGNDGEDYGVDPNTLNDYSNLTNFVPKDNGVKMQFGKEIGGFLSDLDSIINNLNSSNVRTVSNNDYSKLSPNEKITIPSGLRSLQNNFQAYHANGKGNLNKLTNSNHMRGKAIDIRTEPGSNNDPNRNYKGGRQLLEFLKTQTGQALLKKHNLRAYYHKIEGDQYHIDISTASKKHPAGKVFDDRGGNFTINKT